MSMVTGNCEDISKIVLEGGANQLENQRGGLQKVGRGLVRHDPAIWEDGPL